MGFREDFANTPPGPAREKLVYEAAIKQPAPKLVPITIDGPNGVKLTYFVMPNFLQIDSVYLPMSGQTAEKIAAHFNMVLPTSKMTSQIYQAAKQQGGAVVAQPLSGTGVDINGKHLSGQEVVDQGVDRTEFSVAYSDRMNSNPALKNQKPGQIVDGHMKTILQPINGKLGLHGLYDKHGNPIQGGNGETPHSPNDHSEYASAMRGISNDVTVTMPDGKVIHTTMSKLQSTPTLGRMVTNTPGKVQRYDQINPTSTIGKPTKSSSEGPPAGYVSAKFPTKAIGEKIRGISKTLLNNPLGVEIPFEVSGYKYLAKLEMHDPSKTIPTKHKGVSVYELMSQQQKGAPAKPAEAPKVEQEKPAYVPDKPQSGTKSFIARLQDFFSGI